jgi:hypothetical protein
VAAFMVRFVLVYGLLLVPWPGWPAAYGRYLHALGNAAFGRESARASVQVRGAINPPSPVIDTEILFAVPAAGAADPSAPRILGLDSRGVGWVPTALCLALVLATPLPWRRRLGALLLAALAVQTYILLVLGVYLWNQSGGLLPVAFLPFNSTLGDGLEETLVTQIGPSFVVPALIWLAVVAAVFPRPSPAAPRPKRPAGARG